MLEATQAQCGRVTAPKIAIKIVKFVYKVVGLFIAKV